MAVCMHVPGCLFRDGSEKVLSGSPHEASLSKKEDLYC